MRVQTTLRQRIAFSPRDSSGMVPAGLAMVVVGLAAWIVFSCPVPECAAAGPAATSSSATTPSPDTLLGRDDEQLFGTVVGIDSQGLIDFVSPLLEGHVKVRPAALDSVLLGGTEVEPVRHCVRLASGESVIGNLVSVKNDAIALETRAAGRLTIPRAAVTSVVLSAQGTNGLVTDLAGGDPGSWQMKPGDWLLRRGRLVPGRVIGAPLWVKTSLKGPYTLVAVVRTPSGGVPLCSLKFSTAAPGVTEADSSVEANLNNLDQLQIVFHDRNRGGGSMGTGGFHLHSATGTVTLRFACDPDAKTVSLWGESQSLLNNYQIGFGVSGEMYASFSARESLEIESLALLPGIVGPTAAGSAGTTENNTVAAVEFANGDRVQFRHLLLDDGKFTVTTVPGSELTVAVDLVARIVFGKPGDKPDNKVPEKPGEKAAGNPDSKGGKGDTGTAVQLTADQKTALEKPVADFQKAAKLLNEAALKAVGDEQSARRLDIQTLMETIVSVPDGPPVAPKGKRGPIVLTAEQKAAFEKTEADFQKAVKVFKEAALKAVNDEQSVRRLVMQTFMGALGVAPGASVPLPVVKAPAASAASPTGPSPLKPGYVMVQSAVGHFAVKVKSLSADALEGVSDVLGEVRIRRDALRELTMPPPAAPAAAAAVAQPRIWEVLSEVDALEKGEQFGPAIDKLEAIKFQFGERLWPEDLDARIEQDKVKKKALDFFGPGGLPR